MQRCTLGGCRRDPRRLDALARAATDGTVFLMICKHLRIFVAVVALFASSQAFAESPRNWVLDVQLGWYHPEIDEGLRGTPFLDAFGEGRRLLPQLSLERLIYQGIGHLGVGLNVGYSEFYGKGFLADSDERSADNTSLHVVPITVFVAYHFDWLARELNIPFAPYGKAGFGYWLWWSENGLGETSGGGEASGTKMGLTWSAGLAFLLNFFDPLLSNEFDRNFGVNATYVYVDYTQWYAGFRSNIFEHGLFEKEGLDLSDHIWSVGLSFEF